MLKSCDIDAIISPKSCCIAIVKPVLSVPRNTVDSMVSINGSDCLATAIGYCDQRGPIVSMARLARVSFDRTEFRVL